MRAICNVTEYSATNYISTSLSSNSSILIDLLRHYELSNAWIILVAPSRASIKEYLIKNSIDINKIIVFTNSNCLDHKLMLLEATKHEKCAALIYIESKTTKVDANLYQADHSTLPIHKVSSDQICGSINTH